MSSLLDRRLAERDEAYNTAEQYWKDAEYAWNESAVERGQRLYIRAIAAELRAARLDRRIERLTEGM